MEFFLVPENELAPVKYSKILQDSGLNHLQTFEDTIGSTTFLYSRSSAEDNIPLVSKLSISPVSKDLNGTVVNCTDVTTYTVSTMITVLNEELITSKGIVRVKNDDGF